MIDNQKIIHPGFSRRAFLTTTFGASAMMLLGPLVLNATTEEIDPRIARIISENISIDLHNHVYPKGTQPHPHIGPPPGGKNGQNKDQKPGSSQPPARQDELAQGPALLIDSELKKSGFNAVCASFVLDFTTMQNLGDARNNYFDWLTAIDAVLDKAQIRRAFNYKDLKTAHDNNRPTIIQTVEGAYFIEGQLNRVEEVYKHGLRHLQLLHEKDDMVAPLGDTNTATAHLGGLTSFGAEVVKECNRLGILVDLAHASHETVLGVQKVASLPFIVSHTNLDTWTGKNARKAEMMKPRLVRKEHANTVAEAGGIIGIWTHLTDSLQDFTGSIKAMVDAVGIDHVGIGSDTDLLSSREGQGTNMAWPGLTGGFFNAVAAEMLKQGFTPEEIGKVGGGNYCRVFDKVTAVHV